MSWCFLLYVVVGWFDCFLFVQQTSKQKTAWQKQKVSVFAVVVCLLVCFTDFQVSHCEAGRKVTVFINRTG